MEGGGGAGLRLMRNDVMMYWHDCTWHDRLIDAL